MKESEEFQKTDYILKAIKYLGLIIIFFYYTFINSLKRKNIILSDNISSINNNFADLIPRINLTDYTNIPTVKDVLFSRQIYINDNNITNEYIRYIRPINESDEEIYKKALYPNLEFNELFKITRKDQYDVVDFYNVCISGVLLDNKTYNLSEKPLISIILPSYNKEKDLIKTVRSIQNQSFKNL